MDKNIKAGIVGAGGLVAESLLTLLSKNKAVEIVHLVSETFAGKKVTEAHKKLIFLKNKKFLGYDKDILVKDCNVIFVIKQAGESLPIVQELSELINIRKNSSKQIIIDFSADFRLKEPDTYKEWYGFKGTYPEHLLEDTVYGLCELYREKIKKAKLIANPGCYPTPAILCLAPLVANDLIHTDSIIIDAYSGVSGAGVSKKNMERNLAMNVIDNIFPYNIATHRHIPEIEQELNLIKKNKNTKVIFVPHIVGFKYGIAETIYVKLKSNRELHGIYNSFYKDEKFVRIYPEGKIPELQNVVGTNHCDIGINPDLRTGYVIITGMIDNMIKGAAGQAVQNMNIAFGIDEQAGLL